MGKIIDRESILNSENPAGIKGMEFIEYSTPKPQALGRIFEMMGFSLLARHRSREVSLYRQGDVNIILNGHQQNASSKSMLHPIISGFALRVNDAAAAYQRALDLGGWAVQSKAQVMELNIPSIHGVGGSKIFFVDRHEDFSIYDVDFIFPKDIKKSVPALTGLHLFGLVQYIAEGRLNDWTEFYVELFGFLVLADTERFGILPRGRILKSPCRTFYIQLIDPDPMLITLDQTEYLARLGLGTPNVLESVNALKEKGINFVESVVVHTETKGALTCPYLGGVSFELVRD